ncbi:Flagellar biosynthesis protein FlhF [hydrothermal vent metagenome]|uniref:Flagellar biosynthesis protein FlhF n=1 Tax=hydrothermal vent metagenome TaxID=652676 RepID=A0A1W1EDF1_9ZZZZ
MINETFVASDPRGAYEQAVEKYGTEVSIVSAKQLRYDDGVLRCEVVIAVPSELFMKKSFGDQSFDKKCSSEEVELLSEITELKSQLEIIKEDMVTDIKENNTVISEIRELFIRKGISPKWLDMILSSLVGTSIVEDKELLASYIMEEIDVSLKIKEEDLGSSLKVIMLVGPTGVGKTTTIAKLAARYAYLMDRPYKVALLNLDTYKVGAIEQLKHYADIMQIEHMSVSTVDDFKDKLESMTEYDIVLVDTAGMSPYNTNKFIKTVEFVNSDEHLDIEVNLLISATVKYEDMEDIYNNFSFLNINSVIISKFDETKHFGTLLNFMLLYNLPMSYFSIGQDVPDDLLVANKEFLLEHFIGDLNEK